MARSRRQQGLSFRRKRRSAEAREAKSTVLFIVEIIITLIIAFVVVYCVGMRVTIVGNSMEDTLNDGEQILVGRVRYLLLDPQEGDIVVFLPNGNEKSNYYVKRVVGTPGDIVQIKDGLLYVNGELSDYQDTEVIQNAGLAEEAITVGEDEYFVIGDNPNSSEDSRYANIGNVKKDYIVGKAWLVISPLEDLELIR